MLPKLFCVCLLASLEPYIPAATASTSPFQFRLSLLSSAAQEQSWSCFIQFVSDSKNFKYTVADLMQFFQYQVLQLAESDRNSIQTEMKRRTILKFVRHARRPLRLFPPLSGRGQPLSPTGQLSPTGHRVCSWIYYYKLFVYA